MNTSENITTTSTIRALAVEQDATLPRVTARIGVPKPISSFRVMHCSDFVASGEGGLNARLSAPGTSMHDVLVSAPDTQGLRELAAAIVAAADMIDRGDLALTDVQASDLWAVELGRGTPADWMVERGLVVTDPTTGASSLTDATLDELRRRQDA